MGVFVKGSVQIYLNSKKDAEKVHKMINEIEEIVKERTQQPAYFELYDIKLSEDFVEFGVTSPRSQNGEWQVNQVIEQLKLMTKEGIISGVAEFTADLMQEYESWYMDSEEFEEGGQDE
jgi:hypothetical protein